MVKLVWGPRCRNNSFLGGGDLEGFLDVGGSFWILDKCYIEFFFGTPTQLSPRLH